MRTDGGSAQPLEGVRHSENDTGVQYSAVIPGAEANAQGDPTSSVFDPTAGNASYKQIKYDMSDFLGSCVRLYQELTSTQGVPLNPTLTLFIDETGDDYGLGAGVCEEAPDDPMFEDAYVDIEDIKRSRSERLCWHGAKRSFLLMDAIMKTLKIAMQRYVGTLPVGGCHIVRTRRRVRFQWDMFAPVVRGVSVLRL
jgi:hypothetical protein